MSKSLDILCPQFLLEQENMYDRHAWPLRGPILLREVENVKVGKTVGKRLYNSLEMNRGIDEIWFLTGSNKV